jgi:NitT/TauT family transport system permease protein
MKQPGEKLEHIHHYHHHATYSYASRLPQRVYGVIIMPAVVLGLAILVLHFFAPTNTQLGSVNWGLILASLGATFIRLFIAYMFALVVAIPIALLININSLTERIFLPLFDIVQSVPVLVFFPIIIVLFIHYHFINAAAIFIIFLSMSWSIVFSLVGGLRVIPGDIKAAGQIFGIKHFAYLRKITIPAIFPYMVTGSLLAWASGWNIIIVAEVLHTYVPNGTSALDLFGIGSLLVHASATNNTGVFLASIIVLVATIGLINFFIWQHLLKFAERFRFE